MVVQRMNAIQASPVTMTALAALPTPAMQDALASWLFDKAMEVRVDDVTAGNCCNHGPRRWLGMRTLRL